MDSRGWPWKKKSSAKITKAENSLVIHDSTLSSVAHLGDQQENCTNKNYVQISIESYTHFSGLEDQVKSLEAKLSSANSELVNKDNLVKQHAKVNEEAVSGWEKADAEAVYLRGQLEAITLSKLSADERASHLDGALKECMKQIRTVKEENEQKLKEVILMKSQQWEKIKLELESQIHELDKGLREEVDENSALLRLLKESSNQIAKLKDEMSESEAEVELLKNNVQSCEKEIPSSKYELHIVSKEMDICNEEKNMTTKSAEVSNKKHIEDVKTIAKLEGECQRLRSFLRKKLPSPAALAQMKLEIETSDNILSGIHLRKSNSLQESEFLTKQLEVLEKETKRLKEALDSSNAELNASSNLYTKTVGRLKSLEAEMQVLHQEKSSHKSILTTNYRKFSSRISSNSPSITSVSDNGHEDPESPVESHATSISSGKFDSSKSETISELMNDFLEVEKMACSLNNGSVKIINKVKNNQSCSSLNQSCIDGTEDSKVDTELELESMQNFKEKELMLQRNAQLLEELKAELASSHKSYNMAEIQLKCMTESYKSLETQAEELEAENKFLKEKIDELKNDLDEEKQCHHDALVRYKEMEEKIHRDKCMVCASNYAEKNDINTQKDKELAAAEKKLAECQETLHVLGRQLQSMCPQNGENMSILHSKRLQMNELTVKPSYGWSNSNGSCNSDEIDHAEACSISSNSDI